LGSQKAGSADLSREVYGVLGIPIDAVDLEEVVRRLRTAFGAETPFLVSTPNLNFLVSSQTDPEFRESLLLSDLCPVDGVPIVWIARLLGIPIRERVAGSDIFDRLKREPRGSVKTFLFGGPEGVAETASGVLNRQQSGVVCTDTFYPGFTSVAEMSSDEIMDRINASDARFLVASLGAQKGQSWLLHNHHRLKIPVRSHLGAAINFQAGLLRRAPLWVRKFGLEWLWRIKAEPYLWRRYLYDGGVLLRLMLFNVLPLALGRTWRRGTKHTAFAVLSSDLGSRSTKITLVGDAVASEVETAAPVFQEALVPGRQLTIDVSKLRAIDARFFGLLLMVRKLALRQGTLLRFCGVTRRVQRAFRLNGFGFLLDSGNSPAVTQFDSQPLLEVAAKVSSSLQR
jgi:N-acetylglucosaminyldiphosphoundecaprenol N-acetyl-beta-D-mannosaminyltransferase